MANDGTIFRLHDPKNPKDTKDKPLGRWVAEVMINGIRKRFYGVTMKEAKDKLKAYKLDVDTGNYIESNGIKVKQWVTMWLETYKSASLSIVTYDNYTRWIKHFTDDLGEHSLQSIEQSHIQRFVNRLILKKLSPRSIKDIVSVTRQCLEKARTLKYIKDNPADDIEKPKVAKVTKTVLSAKDFAAFKESCQDDPMYPALLIQVLMGLRQGEVLGLQRDDIDIANGTIFVHQAVARDKLGKPFVKPIPKNDSSIRKIPMHPDVAKALRGHVYVDNAHSLLFSTKTGNPISPRNYLRSTRRLFNGKVTNHELRHTFITNMCNLGVNPTITSQLAGHTDTRMVNNVYNHPDMQGLRDAINKQ